jgi:hypothetical protein
MSRRTQAPSPARASFLVFSLAASLFLAGAGSAMGAGSDGTASFPSLGGYLEETLAGQGSGSQTAWSLLSHLRLKLGWPEQEGASVRGEFDVYGLGTQPATLAGAAVDRLYLRLNLGDTQATIGRQRISWGNGTAFSPADVFNPPNPLDPAGPRRGADGVLVRRALGPLGYVAAAAASPGGGLSGSVKVGAHAGHTDFDLGVGYDGTARRRFAFTEAQGDLGVGWHAALAWLKGDDTREKLAGAAGLDYSYAGKLVGLVEYAAGPLPGDVGLDGSPRENPRWAVSATYLPSEVMSLGAHVLLDTSPGSRATAVLTLTQTLTAVLDLSLRLAAPLGEASAPAAAWQGGGELKLRYSF